MKGTSTFAVTSKAVTSNRNVGPDSFDKRLLAYAAVAGAGLLAAAPSAEAGVIYNPTTISQNYPGASGFSIDLNGDLTDDFQFDSGFVFQLGASYRSFLGVALNGGGLFQQGGELRFAASQVIPQSGAQWLGSAQLAVASGFFTTTTVWSPGNVAGPFANTGEGYLGVRIPTGTPGSYYYGWIRLDVTASSATSDLPISATVRGWAYEDTADTAIHLGDEGIPEPGSLGLLAGGILGLAAWRRRKAAKI